MTAVAMIRAALVALGGAGVLVAGYGACGGTSPAGSGGNGGAAASAGDALPPDAHPADARADADAAPPPWGTLPAWDPVWHETKPYAWPEVPHDNMPDCGAGCTAISAYPPFSSYPPSLDGNRVAYSTPILDGTDVYTLLINLDTRKEYSIDDGKSEPHLDSEFCHTAAPALNGTRLLYVITCKSHARLLLRSLDTGETKTVMLFGSRSDGSPARTGLTPTHAYWWWGNQQGPNSLSSFDLKTGEVKTTTTGVDICRTLWFRAGPKGDVVLCTNEDAQQIELVDIAAQTVTPVSPSAYAQNYGYLSPDGTQVVWYDYRDPGPNGEHGSYDFEFAGEIYWKNLVTGQERRITSDNPTDPVKKQSPSIRNGILAWEDWRTLSIQNPQGGSGFATDAAPIRYQTGAEGSATNCPVSRHIFRPEATSYGMLGLGGGTLPGGSTREALVLLACP